MSAYNKLWVALGGLAVLILLPVASKQLGVDYDAQTKVVIDMVVSALTAAGVYGVSNKGSE